MSNIARFLSISAAFLLGACASTQDSHADLDSSRWYMTGEHYRIADIALPAFTLEKQGDDYKIAGTTGCNEFFASAAVSGDKLSVTTPLAMTRKACGEMSYQIELEFTQALEEGLTLVDGQWQLSNGAVMARVPSSN